MVKFSDLHHTSLKFMLFVNFVKKNTTNLFLRHSGDMFIDLTLNIHFFNDVRLRLCYYYYYYVHPIIINKTFHKKHFVKVFVLAEHFYKGSPGMTVSLFNFNNLSRILSFCSNRTVMFSYFSLLKMSLYSVPA